MRLVPIHQSPRSSMTGFSAKIRPRLLNNQLSIISAILGSDRHSRRFIADRETPVELSSSTTDILAGMFFRQSVAKGQEHTEECTPKHTEALYDNKLYLTNMSPLRKRPIGPKY
jgi:hypothetical protein